MRELPRGALPERERLGEIVATELDEVVALADRIMVLYRGKVVGIVPADTPRQTLGLMMTGERPKDLKEVVA